MSPSRKPMTVIVSCDAGNNFQTEKNILTKQGFKEQSLTVNEGQDNYFDKATALDAFIRGGDVVILTGEMPPPSLIEAFIEKKPDHFVLGGRGTSGERIKREWGTASSLSFPVPAFHAPIRGNAAITAVQLLALEAVPA